MFIASRIGAVLVVAYVDGKRSVAFAALRQQRAFFATAAESVCEAEISLRERARALYDAASFRCGVEQPGSSSGS